MVASRDYTTTTPARSSFVRFIPGSRTKFDSCRDHRVIAPKETLGQQLAQLAHDPSESNLGGH